ncbi:MAG: branched-chain amino acid ABC transporter substrate-binding protein [Desulfatiglandales bacterium]
MAIFTWVNCLIIPAFLFGILLPFPLSAFTEQPPDQILIPRNKPVLIGLAAPLSGENARLGIDMEQGMRMAMRQRPFLFDHKIDLLHLDDQCDPGKILSLAAKFTKNPHMAGVIGYMCTTETLNALKAHEKAALPLISATSSSFSLTAKASPILFRINVNELVQAKGMALYARKKKWRRAMVIHGPSPHSLALSEAFKEAFLKRKGNRLAIEPLPQEEGGSEELIKAMKKKRPQLIAVFASPKEIDQVLRIRAIKASRRAAFFLDQRFYEERGSLKLGQKKFDGLYMTSASLLKGRHQEEWLQSYRRSYGEQGIYTFQAHDAVSILIKAIRSAASPLENGDIIIDKGKLLKAIQNTDFQGISGSIRFDDKGDRTTGMVTIRRINKKTLKVVNEIAVK